MAWGARRSGTFARVDVLRGWRRGGLARRRCPGAAHGREYAGGPVVKIYTRKGDDGTTGLWYGGRVPKFARRPEAYGSVDEAASALGLCRAACDRDSELYVDILRVQNELFVAGAE